MRSHATSERSRPTRGVNRDRGAVTGLVAGALQADAAHYLLFKKQIHKLRVFQNGDACFTGATQQTLVHLGSAESQGRAVRAKPRARNTDVLAAARVKDGFVEPGRTGRQYPIDHAETFEVNCTFGRDKLATKFLARKFFLLSEQDPRPAHCQISRRAGAGRPAASDDHVVVESISHSQSLPPLRLDDNTRRDGKCFSTVTLERPAARPSRSSSSGLKLLKIESAPSARIKRLCKNRRPTVV